MGYGSYLWRFRVQVERGRRNRRLGRLWRALNCVLYSTVLSGSHSVSQHILPGQFLKRRTLIFCFIGTNYAATSFFVIIYYMPIYFQFLHAWGRQFGVCRLSFASYHFYRDVHGFWNRDAVLGLLFPLIYVQESSLQLSVD